MKIVKFDIHNFKGINHTTIYVADKTPGNVITLIGLNESGKTTILEALSHFVTEDKDTAGLVNTVAKKAAVQDLIPKDKKAAFTDNISVEATVVLDKRDVADLAKYLLKEKNLILNETEITWEFSVERTYNFEDSRFEGSHALWSLECNIKRKAQKKYTIYDGENSDKEKFDIWADAVAFLRKRLPKIVYFPTFLFDFPDRIYLEGNDNQTNAYYTQVMQDVLDSQGDGLDLTKHIINRIASVRVDHPSPQTFISFFFQKDEKKQIDAVLQTASNQMSSVIFGSWNQILGRNITGKRVQIEWFLDTEKNNAPYLEVSIVDGQSRYNLSERSLGFRWFFSFLLFTQFRKNRKADSATLFLFDEPAANLHSKAQIKLLETFSKIANGATNIIYSTHSHYMVNPLWLEKAYIVENKATDYENENDVDSFAIRKTDINAIRYKTFVGTNPTKTTYFQPVLDALEVTFSPLLRSANALIVEGKNDFYALKYLRSKSSEFEIPEIFPGNGAGSANNLISIFRGWGINFRVLLDDDKAGQQSKKSYMEDFLLSTKEVVTLGEISPQFKGKSFEAILQNDARTAVKNAFEVDAPSKKQYALYFQELLANKSGLSFPETELSFKPINDWIDNEFSKK